MGIDYAVATLPFAVRDVLALEMPTETRTLLLEYTHNLYEDWYGVQMPFLVQGWEAHKETVSIGDSQDHRRQWASKLIKGDMTIYFIQEGSKYNPGWTYWSMGANEKGALMEFLSDLGITDVKLIERYVFFLIW